MWMAGGRRPQAIAEEFGVVTLFHSVLGNVTAPSRFTFGTDYECISYWDPNPAGDGFKPDRYECVRPSYDLDFPSES